MTTAPASDHYDVIDIGGGTKAGVSEDRREKSCCWSEEIPSPGSGRTGTPSRCSPIDRGLATLGMDDRVIVFEGRPQVFSGSNSLYSGANNHYCGLRRARDKFGHVSQELTLAGVVGTDDQDHPAVREINDGSIVQPGVGDSDFGSHF